MDNYKQYIDEYGLMSIGSDGVKGNATQNGPMWTAEFLIAAKAAKIIRHVDLPGYLSINNYLSFRQAMLRCQGERGETYRHPGKVDEWDSMDNVVAHLVFMQDENKKRFYYSGSDDLSGVDELQDTEKNRKYLPHAKFLKLIGFNGSYLPCSKEPMYWNNTQPNKFTTFGWYGRSPGFMAWIDLAVFGKTTFFRHFVLLFEQLRQSFGRMGEADGIRMTYLSFQFLRKINPIYRWTYKLWCRNLLKNFPGGMQDVYKWARQDRNDPIRSIEVKYAE